jgi:hypothetical protein
MVLRPPKNVGLDKIGFCKIVLSVSEGSILHQQQIQRLSKHYTVLRAIVGTREWLSGRRLRDPPRSTVPVRKR